MPTPVIAREMHAEPMKVFALRILFEHSTRSHGDTRTKFDIVQCLLALGQRLVKHIGLAQGGSVINPHTRLDHRSGLLGGDVFGRVGSHSHIHETVA
jgi:hypothetical protein